jgi:uncharacterized membrane protein YphA (DoxX/SURF4 family)
MTKRGKLPTWLSNVGLTALRLTVGGTYLYASLDKITDPPGFAKAIFNYRLVPLPLLHSFALFLPWLELVVGIALILGVVRRGAALLALAMTLMFTLAVTSALARNLDISCGCFHTDGGHAVGMTILIRDILLVMACLVILLVRRGGWSLPQIWTSRSP